MFGMMEAMLSFLRRQVGLRTDSADPAGSLHAKVAYLETVLYGLALLNDGSDGAFNPSSNTQLQSGIYRFTTVNIPANVSVYPDGPFLVILCQGDMVVSGLLTVSGKGAKGGSGGSAIYGGSTTTPTAGSNGFGIAGSGGGGGRAYTKNGANGGNTDYAGGYGGVSDYTGSPGGGRPKFGLFPSDLRALLQCIGAGGGGGAADYPLSDGDSNSYGGGGGNGGGCIVCFARTISGSGAIRADGLNGSNGTGPSAGGGGGGGGGTNILIARSISIANQSAHGGVGGTASSSYQPAGKGGNGGSGVAVKVVI